MASRFHAACMCESKHVGENPEVAAFAHVFAGAQIGKACRIGEHVVIENDVVIGDRVTIEAGAQLRDGARIEDDVFVGPNVVLVNDAFPRSGKKPDIRSTTSVGTGASIGANATILAGVSIGRNAMVGAGAVVVRSVPPNAVVAGNPARILRYVESARHAQEVTPLRDLSKKAERVIPTAVPGVKIHRTPLILDLRGNLTAGELADALPFVPKRYFMVFDVPSAHVRGEHAHRRCHQFLICASGQCAVVVDDGKNRQEIELSSPSVGLHLPPMIWATQYKYSREATLLVFASESYDPSDYIRDYDEFVRDAAARGV